MVEPLDYFSANPDRARQRFRQSLDLVQLRWPSASLHSHRLADEENLEIEWIQAQATEQPNKLLFITTGLHGIEAMIGAAVLQLFITEFLPQLNPTDSGVCLLHPLNPWGMKHFRRVNAHNVDLNRSFVAQAEGYDPSFNQDYDRLRFLLEPGGRVGPIWLEKLLFGWRLARALLLVGPDRILAATLEGQYRHHKGLYYGGADAPSQTSWLRQFISRLASQYDQLCWLDIHSGYGPRQQMTLVDSPLAPREPAEQSDRLGYPRVVQAEAATFYDIHGDMLDAAYRWFSEPGKPARFYGTAFEFGTFGDSMVASLRSLRAMILENQLHHAGARSERSAAWVEGEFKELFYPADPAWRRLAMADARHALAGVLKAERFIEA